jgi:acetyl-CoA carboxylase carboxyl transferase subunit alpha
METNEIQKKIQELQSLAEKSNVNIDSDIKRLSEKLGEGARMTPADLWKKIQLARHSDRPTTLEIIAAITESFMEFHGDRYFGDDAAMVGGVGLIEGRPVTFIGHQKGRNMKENIRRNYGWAHPEGYRKALRLAKQAEKFGRPVVTFIDTAGAYPGIASEERGISEAIARNLKEFAMLRTPVLCFIIGEGGSGGAIGIAVGNEVYMLENSFYTVISPEGCASILLRDPSKAPEAASQLKLLPSDLLAFGIVDGIIREPDGGAHIDHVVTSANIKAQILESLKRLETKTGEQLARERMAKFMSMGRFVEEGGPKANFFQRLFSITRKS